MNHVLRAASTPTVLSATTTPAKDRLQPVVRTNSGVRFHNHGQSIDVSLASDNHLPALPLSVDQDGQRAMVPATHDNRTTLWSLEAHRHRQELWHVEGPGWVVGCHHDTGFVAIAQRLGERPSLSIVVDGKVRHHEEGVIHPPCVPAVWERWALVLLVLQADPWTRSGSTTLCALDITGAGPPMPLHACSGDHIIVAAHDDTAMITVASRHHDQIVHLQRC
jgi:hypothetical protein